MKLNLKNKLLIPIIALIVTGMSISISVSNTISQNAIERLIKDELLRTADSVVQHLVSWIKIIKMDMAIMSEQRYFAIAVRDTFMGKASRKMVDQYLKDAKKQNAFYKSLTLVNQKGEVISSSSDHQKIRKTNVADQPFFQESIKGKIFLSDAHAEMLTEPPAFTVSVPIKDNEAVTGVLFGIINIGNFIENHVKTVKVGKKGYADLIFKKGFKICCKDKSVTVKFDKPSITPGNEGIIIDCDCEEKRKFIVIAKEHETGWLITVTVDFSDIMTPVRHLDRINFMIALALIILISVAIHFIVKSITNPLLKLKQGAKIIGLGNLDYSIEAETQDEIGDLTEAFNDMVRKRKQAEGLLTASLTEKEVLFKELYHRVKNNLEMISSLHYLQSESIQDPHIKELFMESEKRIKSIGMIHEKLYKSSEPGKIDYAEYIHDLVGKLLQIYTTKTGPVRIDIKAQNIFFGLETAVPCGLIMVELVSNAMKYAFPHEAMPSGKVPEIHIALNRLHKNHYTLVVRDNGIGFPDNIDYKNTESMGMQLVNMLIKQLDGDLSLTTEQGTTFEIKFVET
ncbi:histidine kinase dimerization/phosphoacceptor domain -containing protein [Desulfococcaceae bacterium HSG7]|nr:histidine kinase dimerization/phosphoacceptor domain -containing protein [Desulfococcaceae bacterium HSG7]